jgi:DNA helicase HerA-like ATPase
MIQEITTARQIGQIISVQGDQVRVSLAADYLEAGRKDRLGQIASFLVVPVAEARVIGLVTGLEVTESQTATMNLHLIGQISKGRFYRGVHQYPMIGDSVVASEDKDLDVIFDRPDQGEAILTSSSFMLGRFALNTDYKVFLNGRQFFSKHAAILGNSGAGKSCTVAKVISETIKHPNTQIIMFDLHGEYRKAFSNENGEIDPNVTYLDESDLVVPYWLLRYNELDALFIDRSDPTIIANQVSFFKEALIKLKKNAAKNLSLLTSYNVDTPIYFSLDHFMTYAQNMNQSRFVVNTDRYAFSRTALRNLSVPEQEEILLTQKAQFNQGNPQGEIPHALYFQKLTGLIDQIEHKFNDKRYDFLLHPVEHAKRSKIFSGLFPEIKEERTDWSEMIVWLLKLLTGDLDKRRNLTIVDLSGIPFDIIDLTIGLITRLIFDYNFYTPSNFRKPIVMVFEEAHTYIPDTEIKNSFARISVERVAKEGRKYGVSAIVVSQRPSELSRTVLSQCNNMIVLRMNNPEDQHYITKVVSDQFANLIQMLPILSPGEAFVLGDSVPMPLRTLITPPERRPASNNIDFVEAWSKAQPPELLDQTITRWLKQERPQKA